MSNNVRVAILLVGAMVPAILFSQELNRTVIDPKSDKEILYGYCDRSGLEMGEFGKLFDQYYKIYQPDQGVINQLKSKKEGIDILIVLGTWCSDSQEQVPRFFKILDKIHFNKKNLELICVDRDKKAGDVETGTYNIQKIPTFIIYKKGREIGRIVESPYASLEKDLLMFFND
jgi:hypothetical protein